MLLTQANRSDQNAGPAHGMGGAAGARMLADGSLGARLIQAARLAAAIHMAQSAAPRNDGAQFVPRMEGGR